MATPALECEFLLDPAFEELIVLCASTYWFAAVLGAGVPGSWRGCAPN